MFSTLKVKRSPKFVWELPDGICRLNPKCKKIGRTSNQPIKTKKFSTKVFLVPSKCKEAKSSYGGYPTEFASSTQNPTKINETPNLPTETKISLKTLCFVPQKCKGAKNTYGSYPTEFAGSTQNPKKMIGTPNLPIKMKFFS
jgi:hypothetical protein